jgi:spoIIIJ-associated protein
MEKKEVIKKEVEELVKKIIDNFQLEIEEDEGMYHITIKTDEAATIIGRYGETIRSLQKIFEVIFYKKFNQPINIVFNVNDYHQKQKEKLEDLARKMAEKTLSTGDPSYLEKLSSFERKIIHQFISNNYPQLESYSEGEGRGRRLIITKKTS